MKKLGKKVHKSMETIEAYACRCGCSCSCANVCDYTTNCGSNTSSMVNGMMSTPNIQSSDYYKANNDGLASGTAM